MTSPPDRAALGPRTHLYWATDELQFSVASLVLAAVVLGRLVEERDGDGLDRGRASPLFARLSLREKPCAQMQEQLRWA